MYKNINLQVNCEDILQYGRCEMSVMFLEGM